MAAILSPLSIYGDSRKTKLPLLHNTRIHTLGILVVAPSDGCPMIAPRLASTQVLRPDACPPLRSFLARPDPVSARRASGLGFVAQPSNPTVLWWTAANPAYRLRSWATTLHRLLSTTSSCFSCHLAARTWPAGHRVPRVRPTCLSTPRRPRKA
jgi:hypothetical protein